MADCVVGIPSFGVVSLQWAMSLTSMAMPINFTNQFSVVLDKRIDIARNEIVERVVNDESSPRFLFFLDDDVIMPPNSLRNMVHRMENLGPDIGAISGVYYSKSEPGEPLIFKTRGRGSYYDWRVGDFFSVWAAGCGLVLIRTQALKDMIAQQGLPLFAIDYGLVKRKDGVCEARSITEDLYFYTKMGKTTAPNGKKYSLWIDSIIQGQHFDKGSKKFFGLQREEPQFQSRKPIVISDVPALVWVGCGGGKDDFFGCQVTRVDALAEFNPDVITPGDQLPFDEETFDILFSAYLLHTFGYDDLNRVLSEWRRVLKPNGKIWVKLPDIDVGIAQSKENPQIAADILFRGRCGLNKELARDQFSKAGFLDLYLFNNGAEMVILGRKGE